MSKSECEIDDTPVDELSFGELREQKRRLDTEHREGDYPDDTHAALVNRSWQLWHEMKNRAPVDIPACECGGESWGQVPGDAMTCTDCGWEADQETEEAVHGAWERVTEWSPDNTGTDRGTEGEK